MKPKSNFYCIAPAPFLFQLTDTLGLLFAWVAVLLVAILIGLLIYRLIKKAKLIDSKLLTLGILAIAFFAFFFSGARLFNTYVNYLWSFVILFGVLLFGQLIKKALSIKTNRKVTILFIILFLVFFLFSILKPLTATNQATDSTTKDNSAVMLGKCGTASLW